VHQAISLATVTSVQAVWSMKAPFDHLETQYGTQLGSPAIQAPTCPVQSNQFFISFVGDVMGCFAPIAAIGAQHPMTSPSHAEVHLEDSWCHQALSTLYSLKACSPNQALLPNHSISFYKVDPFTICCILDIQNIAGINEIMAKGITEGVLKAKAQFCCRSNEAVSVRAGACHLFSSNKKLRP
jgi:hypothetical protein